MRPVLLVGFVVIVVAVLFSYYNAFPGTFIGDDVSEVRADYRMQNLKNIAAVAFRGNVLPAWPVGNVSFALNRAATGGLAQGFLAINVLLHIANACCVVFLVSALARALPSTTVIGDSVWGDALAVACGAAWALHPLNSQTVATIYQRHELLMTFFFLLAVIQCVGYCRTQQAWRLAFVACWAALAGFSKETAMVLPLVAAAVAWLVAEQGRLLRNCVLASLAAPVAVAIVVGVQWRMFLATMNKDMGVGEYLLTQASVLQHFLLMAVNPARQSVAYDWQPVESLSQVLPQLSILLIILAIGLGLMVWRRSLLGAGVVWCFLTLAPTSSFIPLLPVATETRMYLPLVGLLWIILGIVAALARLMVPQDAEGDSPNLAESSTAASEPPAAVGVAPAIVAMFAITTCIVGFAAVYFGVRTADRATVLRTVETRWTDALDSGYAPVKANLALAGLAMESEDYKAAEGFSSAALASDVTNASAWTTLANSLSRRGATAQAVQVLTEAQKHVGENASISLALGNANVGSDPEVAIQHFEKATSLAPNMSEAWNNLGILLARNPETYQRAEDCYNRAIVNKFDNKQAFFNLAALQLKRGQLLEARASLVTARNVIGSDSDINRKVDALDQLIRQSRSKK